MRLWMVAPLGLALLTACGQTDEQRAATGGVGGAAAGAVVGGPVGAVVGGAAGAAGGAYSDEAKAKLDEEKAKSSTQASATSGDRDRDRNRQASNQGAPGMSRDQVRQAQTALRDQGLYDGPIDGISGPKTKQAFNQYQERNGMRKTASLDRRTFESLTQQTAQAPADQSNENMRNQNAPDNRSPAQRNPDLENQN